MKINDINPYIHVSAARAKALKPGWRKPLPVRVRINGEPRIPWRINMMPMGTGSFYLYLHAIVRKASGTKVGDRVEVEVAFDDTYMSGPMHPMPAWFRAGLEKSAIAKGNWEALPPSRKKEVLRYLARLKSEAARARNLEKALQVLSGGKARFMARAWENGR
ncbi:MAG: hypothetical protein JWO30_4548 [Fibrobacteres bacterium]|nr:hypothetical protein [Fibrobacterota bacterium]